MSGYIQTGGSVPNDLPQGTSHTDLGHTSSFITPIGTNTDGTIESTAPSFEFTTPLQDSTLYTTDTAYVGIWNLLSEPWGNLTNVWENM